MEDFGISEKVRLFIFEHIDSVEQLEILVHMRLNSGQWMNAEKISRELRLSPVSAENRLIQLQSSQVIRENPQAKGEYCYVGEGSEIESTLAELSEAYRVKKHRVLELIFSPMKRARKFAAAFRIKQDPTSGENNG